MVRQVLHLMPLDNDDDSGGSSEDDEIKSIVAGTLLGNDSTVYHVQRVLTNEMHVAAMVIESKDCDLDAAETERIFTLD
jgi:hypothetical protein